MSGIKIVITKNFLGEMKMTISRYQISKIGEIYEKNLNKSSGEVHFNDGQRSALRKAIEQTLIEILKHIPDQE